jgi:hypothetical protein
MSAGTWAVAGIAATFIATLIGVWLSARLGYRITRQAAHEPAVAAARMIVREMEVIRRRVDEARPNAHVEMPHAAWSEYRVAVAARLTRDELMVMDAFYDAVRADAWPLVGALYPTARQAINWLAEGRRNSVKPRKTHRSLAPSNMAARCRCGHTFSEHGWAARRRLIRFPRPGAAFKDKGFECKVCDCPKFRATEPLRYR